MTTTRELRTALFHLQNQQMTVRELREMLFNVEDQDAELDPGFGMWLEAEAHLREAQNAMASIQGETELRATA